MMFCVDSKDCAKVQKNPLMAKHIFIFFASPGVHLSALSARFSAARDEGRQKQPSGGEKPQFFIGKRRKLQIPWAESSKIGENCKFRGRNRQKSAKTAFPHPGESKKSAKTTFPHPGESKKSAKTTFPHPGENRKTGKTAFHPRMTSGKREKERFRHGGKSKSLENCASATAESQKLLKTTFPPRRKIKITQKPRFRHGGKSKSLENCASARAEKQNHPKTTFPPRRKIKIGKNRKVCAAILQADEPSRQDL